jgi:murein hydrolase activator
MLTYFHYFDEAQAKIITQINQTQQQIMSKMHAIKTMRKQLESLKQAHLVRKSELLMSQAKRQTLIHALNQKLHNRKQRLKQLLINAKQLDMLITEKQTTPTPSKPLAANKHHHYRAHAWPTRGKIIHQFGTHIGKSQLEYKGVLIRAPKGQAVHAILDGKVIFAKWLAGYGLMLIVKHPGGLMTLYGRLNTLNKQVNDRVFAGEKIATVGNTGGFNKSALYFSIRKNTQSINPSHWCHA